MSLYHEIPLLHEPLMLTLMHDKAHVVVDEETLDVTGTLHFRAGETARIVSACQAPHTIPEYGVQFKGRGRFLWLTETEIRALFTVAPAPVEAE